jgi:hypothetical protein
MNKLIVLSPRLSRTVFFLTVLFPIILTEGFSQSQFPDLSPKGVVRQRVGFTTITVTYERPAVRGRKIFGGLIPYGKLWRTGAGNCTTIRFSTSVIINNREINAGTYTLLSIPGRNEWTIILNSDTTLYGARAYRQEKDIMRFNAKSASSHRHYESFTIDIDVVPHNATLYLAWERTEIKFQIDTGADKKTAAFISENLLNDKSRDPSQYAEAIEYYYFLNQELDKALVLADKAIAIRPRSYYYRLKIDILEKQKKYKLAIEAAIAGLNVLPKNATELGWDDETLRIASEEFKLRIDSLKQKL